MTAPATFYIVVGGNDFYWRVKAPAEAVGAKPVLIDKKTVVQAFAHPNKETAFPWTMIIENLDGKKSKIKTMRGYQRFIGSGKLVKGITAEFPEHEGKAAVFIRPMLAEATLSRVMRVQGIRTIAETDDNYFAKKTLNLAMRSDQFSDETVEAHAKALAAHDAVVFSTEILRDMYYKQLRKRFGKDLPDMYVCHNNVPESHWPERVERTGPLRVGFMGSASHVWDINLAYPAFHMAHEAGCETYMIGYNPGNPDPGVPDEVEADGQIHRVRSEKAKINIKKWAAIIDKHIPWIEPDTYHRTALPLDIGLCPLRSDDFCNGKSDVKAVEYTISGAAVVCMNTPVYNSNWKHEETCLMAGSPAEMAIQTRRLITDPKLRYELVTNAQQYVLENRGLKQLRQEWGLVLNG